MGVYIDYIPLPEQEQFVNTKLKGFLALQKEFKKAQEQLAKDIVNLT